MQPRIFKGMFKKFFKMTVSYYINDKVIHSKYFKKLILGDYLRDKYGDATRVKPTRGGRLRLHRRNVKIPTANDLVFIKESPDYCHHNSTTGSLGKNHFKHICGEIFK